MIQRSWPAAAALVVTGSCNGKEQRILFARCRPVRPKERDRHVMGLTYRILKPRSRLFLPPQAANLPAWYNFMSVTTYATGALGHDRHANFLLAFSWGTGGSCG